MIHGTTHTYNKGCRCDLCRLAKSEANKILRSKQDPKTGKLGRKAKPKEPKVLKKRGRKPKPVSAWDYVVKPVFVKPVKLYSAWDYTVVRRRAKDISAWEYTVKIPKRLRSKAEKKKTTKVRLSKFETSLDIIDFSRNNEKFTCLDICDAVTDWSQPKVMAMLFDLVKAKRLKNFMINDDLYFSKVEC